MSIWIFTAPSKHYAGRFQNGRNPRTPVNVDNKTLDSIQILPLHVETWKYIYVRNVVNMVERCQMHMRGFLFPNDYNFGREEEGAWGESKLYIGPDRISSIPIKKQEPLFEEERSLTRAIYYMLWNFQLSMYVRQWKLV